MEERSNPSAFEDLPDDEIAKLAVHARLEAESVEIEASPSRWHEADCYVELAHRGWTQQRIGNACGGISQSKVSRLIACALTYAVPHNRPTFWTAYEEITGDSRTRLARRMALRSVSPKTFIHQVDFSPLCIAFSTEVERLLKQVDAEHPPTVKLAWMDRVKWSLFLLKGALEEHLGTEILGLDPFADREGEDDSDSDAY